MSHRFKNIWGVSRKSFKRRAFKYSNDNVCETETEIDEFQHSCEVNTTVISCHTNDSDTTHSEFLDSHLNLNVPNCSSINVDITSMEETRQENVSPSVNMMLTSVLRQWVNENNITHIAVKNLLKILPPFVNQHLPKDPRTLLGTPKSTNILIIGSGTYSHLGVEIGLINQLKQIPTSLIPAVIYLDYSIDGVPISKSTNSNLWPIQAMIKSLSKFKLPPFFVGIYHGYEKPKDSNDYLSALYEELLYLKSNPIKFNNLEIKIEVRSFICDTPAKTFITGSKGHTGYFGCSKCTQEGQHINNRMCFLESNAPLRNDLDFKNRKQVEHHINTSILEKLDVGMVSKFPLDYMHLVCLGVMKKLLILWTDGLLEFRLTTHMITCINTRLSQANSFRPSEFARNIRNIECFKRWKAVELRCFLLYVGPVALKSIIKEKVYKNFMLFHTAIRILEHKTFHKKYIDLARALLNNFVNDFHQLYGDTNVIYNVHNLLHLCDDVELYGNLHSFSAFPFENNMQCLKKMLRKHNKPLQQISNRLHEKQQIDVNHITLITYPVFKRNKSSEIVFENFKLNSNNKNKWFITKCNQIVMLIRTETTGSGDVIIGQEIKNQGNFYSKPFLSKHLQIFQSDGFLETEKIYNVSEISSKVFFLKYEDSAVFIPLL